MFTEPSHPFNKFQDSTPYVYCQQPLTTKFFNFLQKALLGSSAKEFKNALNALRLRKNSCNQSYQNLNDIDTSRIASNISDNLKKQQLHIPRYV